ncbi:TetR/AcrR family transcriptional regulator [Salsuginibacillus kocurii]|uniref:TetR/AcrR family transcriptional regulator n=1 Tax=Salsuginibacillus kocurii TaxID=427078 RepID=UPI000372B751|nr:TetR/AcrR family transcriptional regulator [Salsuginibacillus kocurii]
MGRKSTKTKITDAALTLFEEKGYHAVTVDQIVQESSTSKGGFYHHFKSKDELLYTIHDTFITYVLDQALTARENYVTPAEQLYETVRSFVLMFDKFRSHVTVFYQESLYLAPEYFEEIKKKRDEYKELMFATVQAGKKQHEFRQELPAPIMSMAIFGMINWTYKWYRTDGVYNIYEIADMFSDMIMHAVLTETAREKKEYQRFFMNYQIL